MKIYLLDNRQSMAEAWAGHFPGVTDVETVCQDFRTFMDTHDVEAVVSPANSFGFMDGGYDLAISQYFGWNLQGRVQECIKRDHGGEQVPGTALSVPIDGKRTLIHVPTMRIPERVVDPRIIYHCMRSALLEARKLGVESIVLPAFGGGVGGVPCEAVAHYMREGYNSTGNKKRNRSIRPQELP